MAVNERKIKITDHIISRPHIRFENLVRNVAANPVCKCSGCCPDVVALQYGNPAGPHIPNSVANPVGATPRH